jgi:hypothetical protein
VRVDGWQLNLNEETILKHLLPLLPISPIEESSDKEEEFAKKDPSDAESVV